MASRRWPLAAIVAAVLMAAGLGAQFVEASTTTVTIGDAGLSPVAVTISLGNSIAWHNATTVAQVVTIAGSALPTIQPGATSSAWTPSATGTYAYTTQRQVPPKTSLHGSVDVKAAATPAPSKPPGTPKPTPLATAKASATPGPSASPEGSVSTAASPSLVASESPTASELSSATPTPNSTSVVVPVPANASGDSGPWGGILTLLVGAAIGAYGYRRIDGYLRSHPNRPRMPEGGSGLRSTRRPRPRGRPGDAPGTPAVGDDDTVPWSDHLGRDAEARPLDDSWD